MQVKNLGSFTFPLKAVKNSINSVIFSQDKKGEAILNAISTDRSQIINIKWSKDVISKDKGELEKIGIYNLGEFLSILEMFGGNEVTGKIEENKISINYKANDKISTKYNLSDVSLIQEGPENPKNEIDYLFSFKADKEFLKKVKSIASSLGVGVLKFDNKDGVFSYSVSDKFFHSHIVKEELMAKSDAADFTIFLNIDKLNVIPEGKEVKISIHNKIVEFVVEEDKAYWARYFIAPLLIEE